MKVYHRGLVICTFECTCMCYVMNLTTAYVMSNLTTA